MQSCRRATARVQNPFLRRAGLAIRLGIAVDKDQAIVLQIHNASVFCSELLLSYLNRRWPA